MKKHIVGSKKCNNCYRRILEFLDRCPFCGHHKFIFDNKPAHLDELCHSWITEWFHHLYHKPD